MSKTIKLPTYKDQILAEAKKKIKVLWWIVVVLALMMASISLMSFVSAFTPQDDINLRSTYNINNTMWIKGNNWFDGFSTFNNTDYMGNNITNVSSGFFDYIEVATLNATLIEGDWSGTTVNASQWWITTEGILNDVADIMGSWINNNLGWLNASQIFSQFGNWSADKPNYHNSTFIDDNFAYQNGTNTNITYVDFYPLANGNEPAWQEGRLYYSGEQDTLIYYNDESDVSVNIGEENLIKVKNDAGETINDSNVVYISGASGSLPEVKLAKADNRSIADVLGLVTQASINHGGVGYVTSIGLVRGINTTAFSEGELIYLSPTVAGGITNVKPMSPHVDHHLGFVVRSHETDGSIFVNPRRDIDNFNSSVVIFANGDGETAQDLNFTYNSTTDTLTVGSLVVEDTSTFNVNSSDYWEDLDSYNSSQFTGDSNQLNMNQTWLENFINSVATFFSGAWGDLTGVPAGFADNVDNDTKYTHLSNFTDDVINDTGLVINWSLLDQDTDTHVAGDGVYLYNSSTIMYLNETKLNETIDLRDDVSTGGKNASGPYLYNDTETIYLNETYLNQTIDDRDTDTDTGKAGDGTYLYNDSNTMYLNETYLNTTIANVDDGDWDDITDVPTATPSDGDTTHLSTADQIYDWVMSFSFMQNLNDDLTPQLGGDLDTDGFDIGSTTDEIEDIYLGDSRKICFGDDQDVCLTHDGATSVDIDGLSDEDMQDIIGGIFDNTLEYDDAGDSMGVNMTFLNATMDERDDVGAGGQTKQGDGIYLYNDTDTMYLNETKLNSTIDLRDSDTTYTAGSNLTLTGTVFAINITSLKNYFDTIYQAIGNYLTTATSFGGEVSGTYDNIVLDNNALDDQYYDSESDLTALLDDNYLSDIVEDTSPQLGGYLDTNGQNIGSTTDEIEDIYSGTDECHYFGNGQEASICYNGTALVISG